METMTFRQSALTATALLMSFAVFAQAIVAPNQDNVFLVFGLSIK